MASPRADACRAAERPMPSDRASSVGVAPSHSCANQAVRARASVSARVLTPLCTALTRAPVSSAARAKIVSTDQPAADGRGRPVPSSSAFRRTCSTKAASPSIRASRSPSRRGPPTCRSSFATRSGRHPSRHPSAIHRRSAKRAECTRSPKRDSTPSTFDNRAGSLPINAACPVQRYSSSASSDSIPASTGRRCT